MHRGLHPRTLRYHAAESARVPRLSARNAPPRPKARPCGAYCRCPWIRTPAGGPRSLERGTLIVSVFPSLAPTCIGITPPTAVGIGASLDH